MGRTASPGGPSPNGRNIARYDDAVFRAYGRVCHLCGTVGADTVDHLVPVSVDPSRRWDVTNGRPAHRSCNSARGDSPAPVSYQAPSW